MTPIRFSGYSTQGSVLPVWQTVAPQANAMLPQHSLTSDQFTKTTPKKTAEPLFGARDYGRDGVLRHGEGEGRRCTSTAAADEPCNSGDEGPVQPRPRRRSIVERGLTAIGAIGREAGGVAADFVANAAVVAEQVAMRRTFDDYSAHAGIAIIARNMGIARKPGEDDLKYNIRVIDTARAATPDQNQKWDTEMAAAIKKIKDGPRDARKAVPLYKVVNLVQAHLDAKISARLALLNLQHNQDRERDLRETRVADDLRRPAREQREQEAQDAQDTQDAEDAARAERRRVHEEKKALKKTKTRSSTDTHRSSRRHHRDRDNERGGDAAATTSGGTGDNRNYDGYYEEERRR